MTAVEIDGDRLLADLEDLSAIGRRGRGVHRPAYSEDDVRARHWLAERLSDAGLRPEIDGVGNVVGRCAEPHAVLAGSHVDSVPEGGRLDGALGVVAALEAARVLGGGVDVVSFADEEGAFTGTLGSRSFCGELPGEERAGLQSADGRRFPEALDATGWAGQPLARVDPARHIAYLELHIEQGPILENAGERLGIVTGIVGIRRLRVTFTGRADHAGTTPTELRRDAGAAALRYGTAFLDAIAAGGGPDTVCNVGAIRFEPGAGNIVPARAEMLVEYRDLSDARLEALDAVVRPLAVPIAREARVEVEVGEVIRQAAQAMDPAVVSALDRAAAACGAPARRMPSGAGHDAMIVGRHIPAGMLFAPSIGGRSHSEDEDTDPADLVLAARALATAIADLRDGHDRSF
jgi:beta-ureidopropionase / N-carbamoyl-L-amino-acid hydrolase